TIGVCNNPSGCHKSRKALPSRAAQAAANRVTKSWISVSVIVRLRVECEGDASGTAGIGLAIYGPDVLALLERAVSTNTSRRPGLEPGRRGSLVCEANSNHAATPMRLATFSTTPS